MYSTDKYQCKAANFGAKYQERWTVVSVQTESGPYRVGSIEKNF